MSQELDQENDYVPTAYNRIFINAWLGQSFKCGKTGKCDKVKLYIYRKGTPDQNLTISIYSSCVANDDLPDVELASQVFEPADVPTSAGVKTTWKFSGTQADLVAGKKYVIVVKSTASNDVNNEYRWEVTVTNTGYADGTLCYSSLPGEEGCENWTAGVCDNSFQQYVTVPTLAGVTKQYLTLTV